MPITSLTWGTVPCSLIRQYGQVPMPDSRMAPTGKPIGMSEMEPDDFLGVSKLFRPSSVHRELT